MLMVNQNQQVIAYMLTTLSWKTALPLRTPTSGDRKQFCGDGISIRIFREQISFGHQTEGIRMITLVKYTYLSMQSQILAERTLLRG